jgi:lupus La protein
MSTELAAEDAAPTTGLDKNAQSAEDAAPSTGIDKNAQAAEDAKKMLAELQGENESKTTNDRQDRDSGRSFGGGRGRGGHPTRNYRDNIKSDLTTQEESSDPVAIRKQVLNDHCRL